MARNRANCAFVTSVVAMAYVRGNHGDYDRWAAAAGAAYWSHEAVLPYFRKLECWEGGASAYRGGDGPVAVKTCGYQDPLLDAYAEAGRTAGHAWTDDYNAEVQHGFSRLQMTIGNGRRCSAATAYLRPALGRPNLTVKVRALTSRIPIDKGRATGVEYLHAGAALAVRAHREVIVSSGVINSPQILMLSGIGDPDELARLDIPVKAALRGVGPSALLGGEDGPPTIDEKPKSHRSRRPSVERALLGLHVAFPNAAYCGAITGGRIWQCSIGCALIPPAKHNDRCIDRS